MIKNYFKIAWRNLWKQKSLTLINVLGLSIAFGIALLLCMAAFFDLSLDKFHVNKADIYQLYITKQTKKNGPEAANSFPIPFAPTLKTELSEVKHITRFLQSDILALFKEKELNLNMVNVDADFFSMFSFPVSQGNHNSLLKNKNEVILSKKAAEKLFGKENAIGKTVKLNINKQQQPFIVTAVLEDFNPESTIKFDVAIRFENRPDYAENLDKWNNRNHEVYIQLNPKTSIERFEQSARAFLNLHYKEDIKDGKEMGIKPDENGQLQQLHLINFPDVHFAKYENGKAIIAKFYPYLILGIAFLILFIACVNFINMSIGTSVNRLKEIGMRKTLGANKKQLFFQFWGESLLVFTIAIVIGSLLSSASLSEFKTLFNTQASFNAVLSPTVSTLFLLGFLTITLIAGGYPALVLSRLGTLQSLKGKAAITGRNNLRNVLIVIQFCIAILLISGTMILWSQLDFMRNKNLGFNKTEVFSFPLNGKENNRLDVQRLRNELQGNPSIESISASDNNLGRGKDGGMSTSILGVDYKGFNLKTNMLIVDYDYLKTLDLTLLKGRTFSRDFGSDSLSVVVNETMAKQLEEKNPLDATFLMDDSIKYSVIGVIKDYNFQGLDKQIAPLTLFMKSNWNLDYVYIKVKPGQLISAFETVENAWKKIEPSAEFQGSFLDENIDRTFKKERVMTTIISSGAVIAIVLSCIGLFALSLLIVRQRTKEIGVRKVVGASVASIAFLLSKDFIKLILISLLIATPIAWWMMSKWLDDYAYRINLNAWFFIAAGLLTIVIALATVSFQAIKAALANPVKSLRTE
ncbi:putative ABC transport system permease protein [Pedobacter sp. UYEF25]